MDDRNLNISAGCLLAYGMWAATLVLLIVGAWLDSRAVSSFGLAMSAAAATATVRVFFITQSRLFRGAYDMGRDSVRNLR